MHIVHVRSKTDLLRHRSDIDRLFSDSFGRRSLGEIWDWAYLENPCGEPIVSLCFDGSALVGHYAIVPMPLANVTQRRNSYISMTTMVAESHRKFGLFTTLAQETYKMAQDAHVDFVMGFPNSQSTPGFRKHLNWHLPETDYVATIDHETLINLVDRGYLDKKNKLSLDLADARIRQWRLTRPGGTYQWADGVAYKEHQGSLDLIWWQSAERLRSLPDTVSINLLVSTDSRLDRQKTFDYQFGGVSLCHPFNPDIINREMAISDLF